MRSGFRLAIGFVTCVLSGCEKPQDVEVQFGEEALELADGVIVLRVPVGWKRTASGDDFVEYDAERYATNGSRWATCRFETHVFPNGGALTQELVNHYVETAPQPALQEMLSTGSGVEQGEMTVGTVRLKTARGTVRESYLELRQGAVLAGDEMHAIMAVCDVADKPTEQDRADVRAFLDSISLD